MAANMTREELEAAAGRAAAVRKINAALGRAGTAVYLVAAPRPWVIEWASDDDLAHVTDYATAADALDAARSLHRRWFRT